MDNILAFGAVDEGSNPSGPIKLIRGCSVAWLSLEAGGLATGVQILATP